MFIQIMPLAALEFLQYVFNILGGINIVLNFCCLLCVARLTSPKFGYFISQGVILMATNVLINIVMIILKPVGFPLSLQISPIYSGRGHRLRSSVHLLPVRIPPRLPLHLLFHPRMPPSPVGLFRDLCLHCYDRSLPQVSTFRVKKFLPYRKHLVSHALLAAAVTEVIFLLIKAVRISLAGDASDKLATAAISRFLRHDYVIYALEDLVSLARKEEITVGEII